MNGLDVSRCGPTGNPSYLIEAWYHDIGPAGRIVIAETANNDPTRLSVSLITVEFTPAGTRTKLTLTDQIVALEGMDMLAGSESGWSEVLGNLEAELRREHAHP